MTISGIKSYVQSGVQSTVNQVKGCANAVKNNPTVVKTALVVGGVMAINVAAVAAHNYYKVPAPFYGPELPMCRIIQMNKNLTNYEYCEPALGSNIVTQVPGSTASDVAVTAAKYFAFGTGVVGIVGKGLMVSFNYVRPLISYALHLPV